MNRTRLSAYGVLCGLVAAAVLAATPAAAQVTIEYRNFSPTSTSLGLPAPRYAQKLSDITSTALGTGGAVNFVQLPGLPAIPGGVNVLTAVSRGKAGGGLDAAYISGSDLNAVWGFLYNSGVPFGPTFDEYLGFLLGNSVDGTKPGVKLLQEILDRNNRNVVAIPIVAGTEQLSGYFRLPIGDAPGKRGIGLAGMCQQDWTLRYLPPGENVLKTACEQLLAERRIPFVNLRFTTAVGGTGAAILTAVQNNSIQGFEFASPADDVSQFVTSTTNPGKLGLNYMHFPAWQQQFLITWMIVNKQVWNGLTPAQQKLAESIGRDSLVTSWGENLRLQGAALTTLRKLNKDDADWSNDMVPVEWPRKDLVRLRDATSTFLQARVNDTALTAADRADYATILNALMAHIRSNDAYWDDRQVPTELRFKGWRDTNGLPIKGFPSRHSDED